MCRRPSTTRMRRAQPVAAVNWRFDSFVTKPLRISSQRTFTHFTFEHIGTARKTTGDPMLHGLFWESRFSFIWINAETGSFALGCFSILIISQKNFVPLPQYLFSQPLTGLEMPINETGYWALRAAQCAEGQARRSRAKSIADVIGSCDILWPNSPFLILQFFQIP